MIVSSPLRDNWLPVGLAAALVKEKKTPCVL
jgi:hypothetical protein